MSFSFCRYISSLCSWSASTKKVRKTFLYKEHSLLSLSLTWLQYLAVINQLNGDHPYIISLSPRCLYLRFITSSCWSLSMLASCWFWGISLSDFRFETESWFVMACFNENFVVMGEWLDGSLKQKKRSKEKSDRKICLKKALRLMIFSKPAF